MDVFLRKRIYTGPVRAVILDWAGTAIDYGCMGPVAPFLEVFKNHGVPVTAAEARAPMGLAKKDHIRAMCRAQSVANKWREVHGVLPGELEVDALYREVEPLIVTAAVKHCDLIPGLLDTVRAMRRRGIKIGTTTGYTRPIMEVVVPAVREKGFEPDCVVCSSDVPAGRPFPWMCYRNALELEGYPLSAMVKIGDTVSDIEEGLNAGMWTIGVAMTGNELGVPEEETLGLGPAELSARLAGIRGRLLAAGAHFVVNGIGDCAPLLEKIETLLKDGIAPSNFEQS
ncbi:MAG: phosphonoacetaldehyde hydrolase [Syntrophobacteraceae bacterium]